MTHPDELAALDLYSVWTNPVELGETFDPFRFEHRMAAYRTLLANTNPGHRFGTDNRHNPLWGLMFQHQWQFRTGRLGTGTQQDGRIDPDAPWGYGNYTLCAIPWLGAVAAGVVPDVPVADPPGRSRFRYVTNGVVPDELTPAVADWRAYFTLVSQDGADDAEPARLALWRAHKACLDVVVDALAGTSAAPWPPVSRQGRFGTLLGGPGARWLSCRKAQIQPGMRACIAPQPSSDHLDPPINAPTSLDGTLEITFLRGWCRMVDYLWVAAWPTDFGFMTEHGMDVLPERILTGSADVRALPPRARRNTGNVLRLATTPRWRYQFNLVLWKRVMRTREARDRVLPLLDAVFNPRKDNAADRRRLLGYLLRP